MGTNKRNDAKNVLAAGLAALALAVSPAIAQEAQPGAEALPGVEAQPGAGVTAPTPQATTINESLVGADVYTVDGNNIGEVETIMRDGNQEIVALNLSIGGILGLGAKQVMIRPEEAQVQNDEGKPAVYLEVTETELQKRIQEQGATGSAPNNGIR
ncbi:MAG: PRC-barrel domain-containing protein [Alphaproteobacteria bacterium]